LAIEKDNRKLMDIALCGGGLADKKLTARLLTGAWHHPTSDERIAGCPPRRRRGDFGRA